MARLVPSRCRGSEKVRVVPDGRVALLQAIGDCATSLGVKAAQSPSREPPCRAGLGDQDALELRELASGKLARQHA